MVLIRPKIVQEKYQWKNLNKTIHYKQIIIPIETCILGKKIEERKNFMPCDSSYLEPNSQEIESKRVAKLICFVLYSQNKEIPQWVQDAAEYCYGSVGNIDKLFDTLCSLCKKMNEKEQDTLIYNGRDAKSRDLADWWEEHQKADAKRVKKEAEFAKKLELKKKAKKKLSAAELKALLD